MKENEKILLEYIDDNGLDIFTINQIRESNILNPNELFISIRGLINKGFFKNIEKGKYCRHNFSDEFVIGSFIVSDGIIAYWSALNFHGLTEQFPNIIFVQTSKLKLDKKILEVKYKFIKLKNEKLIGYKIIGFGNNKFRITDIEKTIVDCFDLPQYSGSYPELIKAFYNAKLSAQKMVKYCKAINNIAATKRMAYLSELFKKPKMEYFFKYTYSIINKKYNLFESDGENTGKTNSKWKLIMNMPEEEVLEIPNQNF